MNTEIITILDRSGSMRSIAAEVMGGFDAFVQDQREQPGEARLTLVQFDNQYELNYTGYNIADIPPINFEPRGTTALYDAIGRTLNEQRDRIKAESWADLVIVNIITDGEENSSKEFTKEAIKPIIADLEELGWKFIFLAANQDAFASARSVGISGGLLGNFEATAIGATRAYLDTSATVLSLRRGESLTNLVSGV